MKIGEILREKQPGVYNKLNHNERNQNNQERKQEHLSFSYYEKLMRHDSYSREHGAIKQKGWEGK